MSSERKTDGKGVFEDDVLGTIPLWGIKKEGKEWLIVEEGP